MLVRPEENLPKAALRLSLSDCQRLHITEEELMKLVFSVRLRNDGPLTHAILFDPWWQASAGERPASQIMIVCDLVGRPTQMIQKRIR